MVQLFNVSLKYENASSINIIKYLKNEGHDLKDESFFRIKASSKDYYPENIINDSTSNYFCSKNNDVGAWIQFNFVNSKVQVEGYSILSTYANYLKSFKVEGFDNPNHRHLIDPQPDVGTDILGKEKYFKAKNIIAPKRIIRFSLDGKNGEGNDRFCAYRIKLYGTFFPNSLFNKVTCKFRSRSMFQYHLIFITFMFS